MNFRFTVLETSLNRAEFRWKWLELLLRTSILGIILCLLALALGGAILAGWVVRKDFAVAFFILLGVVGVVAWAVIIIGVLAGTPDRFWMAAAVEQSDRRLMDRLNTLLVLEKKRGDYRTESFALRIARQTQRILTKRAPRKPFSAAHSIGHVLSFLAALAATVTLYQVYSPWKRLVAAPKIVEQTRGNPDQVLDFASPSTNNLEQNKTWGEVRITDPGADLKVTKVDVVPLQIEAAANQPLKRVDWFSTVNGAQEERHELAPPAEPRYAAYQPTLYLDELGLADWDVLTYYAKAETEPKNAYASEVYFLEVRPFREDVLKMPGGEGGRAYQALSDLTALINRQQHVIRQTHQHAQNPVDQENLQNQDRKKLAEAEEDLRDSARHLYAKMAADMENAPIGEALDNLAKAQQSLGRAAGSLNGSHVDEAQNHERTALLDLVAARKMFQKAISDDPKAFEEHPTDDESVPVADSSSQLKQMAEFRNEARAAQDFVRNALDQQKRLEQQTRTAPQSDYPTLGGKEAQLKKSLEDFREQHPKVFKGTETETRQVQVSMDRAAGDLQTKRDSARGATQQATRDLEALNRALQGQTAGQQLANAYKLRQMLDEQAGTLDRCSKPGSNISDGTLSNTVSQARETLDQLKKAAEQEPTRDAFGPALRESLGGQNKVDLDAKLLQLQQAQGEEATQQRAAEARDGLAKVGQAFDASQPKSLQMSRANDPLKPNSADAFAQGMAELDSLRQQLENHRPVPPSDQAKQCRQALVNLQTGMREQFGDNDRGNQILLQLEQMVAAQTPLDAGSLKKLLEALQHFSVETSDLLARKQDQPEVSNIDPARLPPAYRGRIQKYFQKLSEK